MTDQLDNQDAISKKQAAIPAEKLKSGSVKGRKMVQLKDRNNTIVYAKPKQDGCEVAQRYAQHLGVDCPPEYR